ncbi:hypothetical protein BDV93DRAFT_296073 [Ceratobasidium sp. AG-I]|nr:hypothetical protein BDV93DRAFT_296073 [Ceratobasidium sp. AG-I]
MITFKFSGTAVWYFTEAYPQNARVSISIDGSPGELVNTASLANIWRTQSLFWGKGGLSDGPHVVTVSHAGAEGTYIGVDFFKYLPSPGTAATSGASASPTTSSSAAPIAPPKPFPVGAVVGGVIGGITVLGLFLFLFLLRRRRQTPQPDVSGHYPYTDDTTQGAHTPKFNDGHPADFPGAYPPMQTVAYQAPATATNIQYVAQVDPELRSA